MLKLNTIAGYYEPLKSIKKSHTKNSPISKKELIEYLNGSYRHAIRKILMASPASFEDSPIYELCMDVILFCDDISNVTVKWIEHQIKINKGLEILKNIHLYDSPNAKKLRLIKTVTEMHQYNLAIDENVVSFVNSNLALEDILNAEYKSGFFAFFENSDAQQDAIVALKDALNEKSVNLLSHLSLLQKGTLGAAIRDFVKQGQADILLEDKTVSTISGFITALHHQVNEDLIHLPATHNL